MKPTLPKQTYKWPARIGAVLLAICLFPDGRPLPPAQAQEIEADEDHETARKALEGKEILPLGRVLAIVEQQIRGDVIEIELERDGPTWIYDIEIIDETGRVRELDLDARTGAILKDEPQ